MESTIWGNGKSVPGKYFKREGEIREMGLTKHYSSGCVESDVYFIHEYYIFNTHTKKKIYTF